MSRVLPILFNTEMVRAILDGRKTVTRRIVKGLPKGTYRIEQTEECELEALYGIRSCGALLELYKTVKLPYQPGDILYARETWCKTHDGMYWYKADNICQGCTEDGTCIPKGVPYHKTCNLCEYLDGHENIKWHPSIHMPKEAARIWLKVADVRVERLQEVTGAGILAEGVNNGKSNPTMGKRWENMQRIAFENLWNSTIKKSDLDRYGWSANPWVWVIEFERCEKPESV